VSNLRFDIKPAPVIPEHRPVFKIAQLLLILLISSRGRRSSLPRLQLFNWALKAESRMSILYAAAEHGRIEIRGWGFDPAVPIALRFAVAEGLIRDVPTGYELTEAGETFARDLLKDGLMSLENEGLKRIGTKITQAMIDEVARRWEDV
jgi:hypothetical protein